MHVTRSGASAAAVDLVRACVLRIFLEKGDDDDNDDDDDNESAAPPSASEMPAHILLSPRDTADGVAMRERAATVAEDRAPQNIIIGRQRKKFVSRYDYCTAHSLREEHAHPTGRTGEMGGGR